MLYLTSAYFHQGRYDEAESIQLLAIEYLTDRLGENVIYVLRGRWNLACTWLKQGKVNESRKLAVQVVTAIEEKDYKEYEKVGDFDIFFPFSGLITRAIKLSLDLITQSNASLIVDLLTRSQF